MSTLIGSLSEFCATSAKNAILLTALCWAIWPGGMFVFGIIFESRLVPISRRQSVIFWPGDLTFAIMFITLLKIRAEYGAASWENSAMWWICLTACGIICAFLLRDSERNNYKHRAHNSPTKILHDIVWYFLIPVVLLGIGIPALSKIDIKSTDAVMNWLALAAILFYFASLVFIDRQLGFTYADIEARHPSGWQPIWKTRKIKKS